MAKKRRLNVKLIEKIIKRLEQFPKAYDQTSFMRRSADAPCGTACCIAGEAIICSERTVEKGLERLWEPRVVAIWADAEQLLGLSYEESSILFTGSPLIVWPSPFRGQWERAKTERGRAGVAIRFLKKIIELDRVPGAELLG